MIEFSKETITLLLGFFLLFLPPPNGSGTTFKLWSTAAITSGVIVAFALFYIKGASWINAQLKRDNRAFIILFVLFCISGVTYLSLSNIDTPNQLIRIVETLTYCVVVFFVSLALSLLSVIVKERKRG